MPHRKQTNGRLAEGAATGNGHSSCRARWRESGVRGIGLQANGTELAGSQTPPRDGRRCRPSGWSRQAGAAACAQTTTRCPPRVHDQLPTCQHMSKALRQCNHTVFIVLHLTYLSSWNTLRLCGGRRTPACSFSGLRAKASQRLGLVQEGVTGTRISSYRHNGSKHHCRFSRALP
jgi:hypothetical protein